jgi:4-diphosphocytidyl-2-C-methyl-D-erythritol kinase
VGEEVTPIASLADLPILIVKPSAGVSTPECFKAIDSAELEEFDGEAYAEYISHLTEQKESPADKLGSFLSGGDLLVNDLQAPAVSAVPQIGKIIEALKDAGAPFAAMTGSGSAVFALFDDEKNATVVSEAVSSDPRTEDCVVILTKTV